VLSDEQATDVILDANGALGVDGVVDEGLVETVELRGGADRVGACRDMSTSHTASNKR
jgi:hypothetical protein